MTNEKFEIMFPWPEGVEFPTDSQMAELDARPKRTKPMTSSELGDLIEITRAD